jgi:hypothetical protein
MFRIAVEAPTFDRGKRAGLLTDCIPLRPSPQEPVMNPILRRTFSLFIALVTTAAFAQEQGRWSGHFLPDKTVDLALQQNGQNRGFNNRFMTLPLARLQNLNFSRGQSSTNAHFEMKAEAGTIAFDGVVSGDTGAGKYAFTPDPRFNQAMSQLGLPIDPDQQLSYALNNVTVAYAKTMRDATGATEGERVLKMAKLDVDLAYVQKMSQVFSQKLGAEAVIDLAKHDITSEYVQRISEVFGQKLGIEEVVDLAKHDVTPEYVRGISQAFGQKVDPEQIGVAARHDVTPEYVATVRKLLPAAQFDEIDSLQRHDVAVQFITAAQKCHSGITADEVEHLKKKYGSPCASLE